MGWPITFLLYQINLFDHFLCKGGEGVPSTPSSCLDNYSLTNPLTLAKNSHFPGTESLLLTYQLLPYLSRETTQSRSAKHDLHQLCHLDPQFFIAGLPVGSNKSRPAGPRSCRNPSNSMVGPPSKHLSFLWDSYRRHPKTSCSMKNSVQWLRSRSHSGETTPSSPQPRLTTHGNDHYLKWWILDCIVFSLDSDGCYHFLSVIIQFIAISETWYEKSQNCKIGQKRGLWHDIFNGAFSPKFLLFVYSEVLVMENSISSHSVVFPYCSMG